MASRRGYLTQDELAEYTDITIVDTAEADVKISQGEEIIDAYVGPQDKFYDNVLNGRASAGSANTITLQENQKNIYEIDYFKLCEVEILGGAGAGQRRIITGSTKAGVLTLQTALSPAADSTSFYRIYQLGKFPRKQDVVYYAEANPFTYYKQIPEAVKRATAAQLEFMIEMGDSYFAGDKTDMQSESIGDYSYSKKGEGTSSISKLIAPKAKVLLNGIFNRTGQIIA